MILRDKIEEYLSRINEDLKSHNINGEIVLTGGAVMSLIFNARNLTKDIDAYFSPSAP